MQELREMVERRRAALMDTLDELDGMDDGQFDVHAFRARIAAEVARGKVRALADPLKAGLIMAAVALAAGALVMATLGRGLMC